MLLLCNISAAPILAQQPTVTAAAAPIFPRLAAATRASGKVTVEVKVDKGGSAISNSILDGHPLFREAAQNAAQLWRFAPDSQGDEVRSVRLTFVFSLVSDATESELTPVFIPPYQVEVKQRVTPQVDINERPTNSRKKSKRQSRLSVQSALLLPARRE